MQDFLRTQEQIADLFNVRRDSVQPLLVGANLQPTAPAPFTQIALSYQLQAGVAAIITRLEGRCTTLGSGIQQTREFPLLTFANFQYAKVLGATVQKLYPVFQPINICNQDQIYTFPAGVCIELNYQDLNVLAAYNAVFNIIGFQLQNATGIDVSLFNNLNSQVQG